MFVLVTYDVCTTTKSGVRRLNRVARTCKDYGLRVQNSVFECVVSEAQYVFLRAALSEIIDNTEDTIRFYRLGNNWEHKVDSIGRNTAINVSDTLIL